MLRYLATAEIRSGGGQVPEEEGAARAQREYRTYCGTCHGMDGNGDGPLAKLLNPKPARHTDREFMQGLTDAYLFKLIKEGGPSVGKSPLMAKWEGTLSDGQIRAIIAYMRGLAE